MTEIMFLTRNFPDANPRIHVSRLHRGDVICWRFDGWPWSEAELKNPKLRIIRIGLTQTEADFLARSEDDPFRNKTRAWIRWRFLDFDDASVKGRLRSFIRDDSRPTPIFDIGDARSLDGIVVEKGNAEDRV